MLLWRSSLSVAAALLLFYIDAETVAKDVMKLLCSCEACSFAMELACVA
jgi:hypothetical protein